MKFFFVSLFIFFLVVSSSNQSSESMCTGIRWFMNQYTSTKASLIVAGKLKITSDGEFCQQTLNAPRGHKFVEVSPNPSHNCHPVPCKGELVHLDSNSVTYKLFLVHPGESFINYKHDFEIAPE
jgi:hypothetical protein